MCEERDMTVATDVDMHCPHCGHDESDIIHQSFQYDNNEGYMAELVCQCDKCKNFYIVRGGFDVQWNTVLKSGTGYINHLIESEEAAGQEMVDTARWRFGLFLSQYEKVKGKSHEIEQG